LIAVGSTLSDIKLNTWGNSGAGNISVGDSTGKEGNSATDLLKESPTFQGGVGPAFLFLQLFYSQCIGREEERPVPIPLTEVSWCRKGIGLKMG